MRRTCRRHSLIFVVVFKVVLPLATLSAPVEIGYEVRCRPANIALEQLEYLAILLQEAA